MARVPNYIYRGDDLGIGQGISNLGQALFGDPQAAAAMESTRAQTDYTRTLMAEHQYNVEKERAKQAKQEKINAAILKRFGLGDAFADSSAPAAPLPPQTMEAAAPAAAPSPGVLDAYASNLGKTPVSEIQTAPLTMSGTPATAQVQASAPMQPVSLAGSDMWNADEYNTRMNQRESRGNPNAKNPQSSAYGLAQMTQQAWQDAGMPGTPEQATPEMYAEGVRRFTEKNRDRLTQYYGQAPDAAGTYTAHHFGATGAEKILNEAMDSPQTPINQVISPEAFAANRRELTNPDGSVKTVGQLMGEYQEYFRGNSPIQPMQSDAPSALAQTMTAPDINTLNPQVQTAMPEPPMPQQAQPQLDIQTAAGPAPSAAPVAAPNLPATTPTQDPVNQGMLKLAAATTPQPGALPNEPAQTGSPLDTFLDSLNDAEKADVLMTIAGGGDVLDTLSKIATAKAKLGGPAGKGQYASNAQDAERWNVLNAGNQALARGETMDPEIAQQYVSAWAALSKEHSFTDQNGQVQSVPAVDLLGYGYRAPPGLEKFIQEQHDRDFATKPLGTGEQQFGAAVITAQNALNDSMAVLMPDGKNLKNEWTSVGMYQPKSKIGQTIMSRVAPKQQMAASQFQNAVNQAYSAISGKAVTESEAGRLFASFIPTPLMDRGVAGQRMLNLKDLIDNLAMAAKTRGRWLTEDELLPIMQEFDTVKDAPSEGAAPTGAPAPDAAPAPAEPGTTITKDPSGKVIVK